MQWYFQFRLGSGAHSSRPIGPGGIGERENEHMEYGSVIDRSIFDLVFDEGIR